MFPLSGSSVPVRIRSNVDFPDPFGPINPIRLPSETVKDTSSNSGCDPKAFEIFCALRIGGKRLCSLISLFLRLSGNAGSTRTATSDDAERLDKILIRIVGPHGDVEKRSGLVTTGKTVNRLDKGRAWRSGISIQRMVRSRMKRVSSLLRRLSVLVLALLVFQ